MPKTTSEPRPTRTTALATSIESPFAHTSDTRLSACSSSLVSRTAEDCFDYSLLKCGIYCSTKFSAALIIRFVVKKKLFLTTNQCSMTFLTTNQCAAALALQQLARFLKLQLLCHDHRISIHWFSPALGDSPTNNPNFPEGSVGTFFSEHPTVCPEACRRKVIVLNYYRTQS